MLLRKIILFLADNIGSNISINSIGNILVNEGLLEDGKRKGTPSAKVANIEVDFIATSADDKLYVQVTETMMSEDVRVRELMPLQKIRDNYERVVLYLDTGLDNTYDGIESKNIIDWLLEE